MSTSAASMSGKSKMHALPILLIIVGLVLLLFWIAASLLQIQTSEAFILASSSKVGFIPDTSILMQPFALFGWFGTHPTPETVKATMWGWGIELLYLIFVLGEELVGMHLKKMSKKVARVFFTLSIILILFDAYTDFQYGTLGSGTGGQIAFALVTSVMVATFGFIGVLFIEWGIKDFGA